MQLLKKQHAQVSIWSNVFFLFSFILSVQKCWSADFISTLVPLSAQQKLSLTIYEKKMVLVKDKRKVPLGIGINRLLFENVSAEMVPSSALTRLPYSGQDLNVLEQAFHYNPLSRDTLLNYSIGLEVSFLWGGQWLKGTLLSAASPCLVQKNQRIYSVSPGDIVFESMPHSVYKKPTLEVVVDNKKKGEPIVELSYLASGISWKASYIGELNPEGTVIDIGGWVTVENNSTTKYSAASLNLVAAEIDWTLKNEKNTLGGKGVISTQRLLGSPLYTIGHPVTLGVGEKKELSLLRVQDVKLDKAYYVHLDLQPSKEKTNVRVGQQVETWFSFNNSKVIGASLPEGEIRLYRRDKNGSIQFLGEDGIPHTPADGIVHLRLGNSQNVSASLVQTDYKVLGRNSYEVGYRLVLNSVQPHPVSISVRVPVSSETRIIKESMPKNKEQTTDTVAAWDVPIQPNSHNELRFRFRVNNQKQPTEHLSKADS